MKQLSILRLSIFKFSTLILFAVLMTSASGCTWLADVLVSNVSDSISGDRASRDGRDRDADGLTASDIVARNEEAAHRKWASDERLKEWEAAIERDKANKQRSFTDAWQDHLNRESENR